MRNTSIIWIFCLLQLCLPKLSATEYGLYFKAYEVTGAERTSLLLDDGIPYEVNDSWEVDFMLRVRNEIEYGTIMQLDLDKTNQVRFGYVSVNPNTKSPALVFEEALFVVNTPIVKNQWIPVSLLFNIKENKINLKYADADTTFMVPLHGTKEISALFGKGSAGDIAPIDIKDVRIKNNGRLIRHWKLWKHNGDVCLDELKQAVARAVSPLWLVDNHIEWKKIYTEKSDTRIDVAFNPCTAHFYLVHQDRMDIWN